LEIFAVDSKINGKGHSCNTYEICEDSFGTQFEVSGSAVQLGEAVYSNSAAQDSSTAVHKDLQGGTGTEILLGKTLHGKNVVQQLNAMKSAAQLGARAATRSTDLRIFVA
jgi:hypothetical protein